MDINSGYKHKNKVSHWYVCNPCLFSLSLEIEMAEKQEFLKWI